MTRNLITLAALAALGMSAGAVFAQPGGGGPAPGSVNAGSSAMEGKRQLDARDQIVEEVAKNDKKPQKKARGDRAVPAVAADLVVGSRVSDLKGQPIGTIEAVEADGAVVFSGAERAKVPLDAFGKNRKGLLMPITKAEFDAAAAAAKSSPQG